METRSFTGVLRAPNGVSVEMSISVYVSQYGGRKSGSGTFDVPSALVGSVMEGVLDFDTDDGESFKILVKSHAIHTGQAEFVTSGPVPEARRIA